MLMSIVKLSVLREYWEKGWCHQATVAKHFTRPRFEAILSDLHFADPEARPSHIFATLSFRFSERSRRLLQIFRVRSENILVG